MAKCSCIAFKNMSHCILKSRKIVFSVIIMQYIVLRLCMEVHCVRLRMVCTVRD